MVVGQTLLLQSDIMVKFDRDAVDYSLYLVTGRELLPEGKVSGWRRFSWNAASHPLRSCRTIMRAWKR